MFPILEFRREWSNQSLLTADDVEAIRAALDSALYFATSNAHTADSEASLVTERLILTRLESHPACVYPFSLPFLYRSFLIKALIWVCVCHASLIPRYEWLPACMLSVGIYILNTAKSVGWHTDHKPKVRR